MATKFSEFDSNWGKRRPNETELQFICMCPNFGFICRVFVRRGTKSNVSAKMETENNMEVAKVETNEVANLIPELEPSDFDAPPKGKLMYILVF